MMTWIIVSHIPEFLLWRVFNQWHKFHTLDGCIFEEVSTTHFNNDSFYEDPQIAGMERDQRKTKVDNWAAYFRSRHAL